VAAPHADLLGDTQNRHPGGTQQNDAPAPGQAGRHGGGTLPRFEFSTFFIGQFDNQRGWARHA
jgi:hypothetical protein